MIKYKVEGKIKEIEDTSIARKILEDKSCVGTVCDLCPFDRGGYCEAGYYSRGAYTHALPVELLTEDEPTIVSLPIEEPFDEIPKVYVGHFDGEIESIRRIHEILSGHEKSVAIRIVNYFNARDFK